MALRLKSPPAAPNTPDANSNVLFQEYLQRISAIPGVDSAATVTGPPFRPAVSGPTELVGVSGTDGGLKSVVADIHLVSPDYFERSAFLCSRDAHFAKTTGRSPGEWQS